MDLGLKEIVWAMKEMIAPSNQYTRDESERMVREAPDVVKDVLTEVASPAAWLIPGITRKQLVNEIRERQTNRAGLGGVAGKTAAEAASKALAIYTAQRASGVIEEPMRKIGRLARAKKARKTELSPEMQEKINFMFRNVTNRRVADQTPTDDIIYASGRAQRIAENLAKMYRTHDKAYMARRALDANPLATVRQKGNIVSLADKIQYKMAEQQYRHDIRGQEIVARGLRMAREKMNRGLP